MRPAKNLEAKKQVLKVSDVATLLSITPQYIYKMAAKGFLASIRI